jgi:hypothetical protein
VKTARETRSVFEHGETPDFVAPMLPQEISMSRFSFRIAVPVLLLTMLTLLGVIGWQMPEPVAQRAKQARQQTEQAELAKAKQVTKDAGNTFCTTQHENIKTALHYSVTKLSGRTATIAYPTWIGLGEENRKLLLFALKCTVYGNALYDGDIQIVDLNGVAIGGVAR